MLSNVNYNMQFDILTLFPDLIYSYSDESILGRAQKNKLIEIKAHNFRDFTLDKQHHVDDRPYGGGPGMVLQVQPIYDCLKSINALSSRARLAPFCHPDDAGGISVIPGERTEISHPMRIGIRNDKTRVVILDPAGKKFDQRMAEKFSKLDRLVLICGRYEGFDARVYKLADERISVGDFVLAGGELPALSVVEATSRLIPGVLGNEESLLSETFGNKKQEIGNKSRNQKINKSNPKLKIKNFKLKISAEYPQYTRPTDFMGMKVPKVLLSGDHKKVEEWRKKRLK